MPETGELHWYIEDPTRAQLASLAGADAELPELVPIDAVISAHNEEATVADVTRALILSGAYGRVIVVDDGSTDRTADRARAAGAEVVRLPENKGKTGAMLAGAITSKAPAIAFFDADALNMTPEHGRTLARAFHAGRFAQVCGVLDDGVLNTSRIATGQRIVDRRVLDAIPVNCQGYAAETAINAIADKIGPTQEVRLAGLKYRTKRDKVGTLQGTLQGARMAAEMAEAGVALAASGGTSCRLGETPPTPAQKSTAEAAAEAERNWTPKAQAALEACLKRPGGDLITCSQDPAVLAAVKKPGTLAEATAGELAPDLRADLARLALAEAAEATTTSDRAHLQELAGELGAGTAEKPCPCATENAGELGAARPKADPKKGDAGDDALATAGDVADAAAAAVSLISAGKRIAERGVQDPDPECRKTVREWVANHPILARLFKSPDLTKLAGIEGAGDEDRFRDNFADAYLRALADLRGSPELGIAGEDCAVCETEDRAVLAHLGVSQQEVDAIYNVAASSGSTIADLFAPGVGKGLRQTADAVKELANPQPKKPKKGGGESQAAACQRELDKSQADVALAKQWVQQHPILVALTSPSLARLAGEEGAQEPETTTGRTALSSGVVTVTAKE